MGTSENPWVLGQWGYVPECTSTQISEMAICCNSWTMYVNIYIYYIHILSTIGNDYLLNKKLSRSGYLLKMMQNYYIYY